MIIINLIKMLYNIFLIILYLFTIIFNCLWLICTLLSASIPWFTLILFIVLTLSKFFKLKNPNEKKLIALLGGDEISSYWAIVNQGGAFDAPENTIAAIKKCMNSNFRNILIDANLTSCGEIVIVNKTTLEKAGRNGNVNKYTLNDLKNINVTEHHPLGSKFDEERILTLTELLKFLETHNLTIFLNITDLNTNFIEKLKYSIKHNDYFLSRIIIVSKSPIAIYQLRKLFPDLICGLWTDKLTNKFLFKRSTLIISIYGAIIRNIISPVIGISIVLISKDEFNKNISELWRNVGVRPIVYKVNSPNEKRYFQLAMKTQYLTDSIRSEPQLIIRS